MPFNFISRTLLRGIVVLLAACAFSALVVAADSTEASNLVPDWTLEHADGQSINFYTDSEGRPAVLLFWATWCPYCRALMPNLEKVRGEFADKGVKFYALNIWEDGDPIAHMREHNYGFDLLLNADEVAKLYGIKGTPGVIVVGADRQVIYIRKSGTTPVQVETDLRFVLNNAAH